MIEHFPKFDRNIVPMNLCDFLQWANDSQKEITEHSLRLPPMQRSALWTPRQILDLWDSLLRGLPIGSFYLSESNANEECRPLAAAAKIKRSLVGGFDLLDGQQRVRTMLLADADPLSEGRCLWIDPIDRDEDRVLTLRLTTASQPFGYSWNGSKLPRHERGEARYEFDQDESVYRGIADHLIFEEHIHRVGRPPKPYKSPLAIPFHEIFKAWRADQSALADFISSKVGSGLLHLDSQQVAERIDRGLRAFASADVGLILVKTESNDLLRLFDRIGAGGTPLSGEERLYSIYKHHEPYVLNAIEDIYAHAKVGRVFPATKIAGCALRIAAVETKAPESNNDRFDLPEVASFMKEMRRDSELKQKLRDIIPAEETRDGGLFLTIFTALFAQLSYRGEADIGIPHVMMPDIAPQLVHVLSYWMYLSGQGAKDIVPECRQEMIRFALFWHLCCYNNDKASRHALRYLKTNKNHGIEFTFPGKALYDLLIGQGGQERCADSLSLPEEMRAYGRGSADVKLEIGWLQWKDRFERFASPHPVQDLFRKWWHSGGKMLLWIQRSYFYDTFRNYNPASGRDDDKPYDLDHICARATWLNSINPGNLDDDERLRKTASDGRYILGEGIGNLWWIDSRVNRRAGDASIAWKLAVPELQEVIKTAFDEASLAQWRAASVEGNQWSATAREAFQSSVEARTLWLYERFFRDLGFEEWLKPAKSPSVCLDHDRSSGVESGLPCIA